MQSSVLVLVSTCNSGYILGACGDAKFCACASKYIFMLLDVVAISNGSVGNIPTKHI